MCRPASCRQTVNLFRPPRSLCHLIDFCSVHTQNESMAAGTAFAISYHVHLPSSDFPHGAQLDFSRISRTSLQKIWRCLAFGTSEYAKASSPVRILLNMIKHAMEAIDHVLCSGCDASVPVRGLYMLGESIEIGTGIQNYFMFVSRSGAG